MSEPSIILYGSKQSGHSYKSRLLMLLADIPHQYRHVDIFIPFEERQEDFKKLSLFGEVPVLAHGGQSIVQSNAILLHLSRYFNALGGDNEKEWDDINCWLFWEANRIGRSYPNYRFCNLFAENTDAGLLKWFKDTTHQDMDRLEQQLAGQEFILGKLTIADLACSAYLLYADDPSVEIANWPNVASWLDRIRALPRWRHPLEVMVQETAHV